MARNAMRGLSFKRCVSNVIALHTSTNFQDIPERNSSVISRNSTHFNTTPCCESIYFFQNMISRNSAEIVQCCWYSVFSLFGSNPHFFLKRFHWFITEISWFEVCPCPIKMRVINKKVVFFGNHDFPHRESYSKFNRFWWILKFLVVFFSAS